MTSWIFQWKPFWVPVGDSFQKAYLEEWVRVGAVPSEEPSSADQGDVITESADCSFVAGGISQSRERAHSGERTEAPLPPLRTRPKCDFIHPQQLSPLPERLELPFSTDDILSGYEDIVSSGSDHFTMWVKVNPHEVLAEHVVAIHKVETDFRDAFV